MPGNRSHRHTGGEREDNQERNADLARPEKNHRLLNRIREDKHPVAEIANPNDKTACRRISGRFGDKQTSDI